MKSKFLYEAKGQILIIHLPAELDHHNCQKLKYETDLLMGENYVTSLVFDFTKTTFMDSSGIGTLLNRYKQIKNRGSVFFYGAGTQVMRILKIGGVLGLMECVGSKEEAVLRGGRG